MRPGVVTESLDGSFNGFGVGRLLLPELVQELVGGTENLDGVGHSGSRSAGTPYKRHALLVAAPQPRQGCPHGVFIHEVLELLK